MNSSNHFMAIFPSSSSSSSCDFNLNHYQCQDEVVPTIQLSTASETSYFQSNHDNTVHSMMMIDNVQNEDTNQGDDDYQCELILLFSCRDLCTTPFHISDHFSVFSFRRRSEGLEVRRSGIPLQIPSAIERCEVKARSPEMSNSDRSVGMSSRS